MENNHVLIGLIILTVACIYLFYTNFQKNKEYEMLVSQVTQLRIQNEENKRYLSSLHQQTPTTMEQPSEVLNAETETLNIDLGQGQNSVNNDVLPPQMNNIEVEVAVEPEEVELDIQLNDDELEEINNLDNLDNNGEKVEVEVVEEEFELNDDVASVVESVLMEPTDLHGSHPDNVSNDVDIVEILTNEVENSSEVSSNQADEENAQMLNMTNANLETMTHKELKLMCKNLGLKTKGNKEELMSKIKEKLVNN